MERKTINIGSALADFVKEKPYGSFIYYQDIERVTETKYGEQKYYNAIDKAKKILVNCGKAIKNVGKGQYQVLYPGDYTGAYTREVRLARQRINQGGKILKHAPKQDMNAEELQSFNHVSDFHQRLEAKMKGDYVEVKMLSGKRHPLEIKEVK